MKSYFLFSTILFTIFTLNIFSCGIKDKNSDNSEAVTDSPKLSDDGIVPDIDIASLKDEASVLDAMKKVVDARIADEKNQKNNPDYSGHYLELTKLYTDVLNASTVYSNTISNPAKAVEFHKKVSAIQDKMYK